MMGRLSVVVLAVACLVLGFVWGARGAASTDQGGGQSFLSTLTDDLSLRDEQVVAIGQLLASEDKDIQELTEQHRRQLEGPIAARLDKTVEAMLAVLDDEQLARYHDLTAEHSSAR